jgi:hypothetical protein
MDRTAGVTIAMGYSSKRKTASDALTTHIVWNHRISSRGPSSSLRSAKHARMLASPLNGYLKRYPMLAVPFVQWQFAWQRVCKRMAGW